MKEKTFIPTYVPNPQLTPHPEERQQRTILPGSRLAVIGVFVEIIRRRFVFPNAPEDFQWYWRKDTDKTTILVESAFSEASTGKNFRPAVIVDADDQTIGRTTLGDLAGKNLQRGLTGYFHLVTLPIMVECIAATRGESSTLSDTVGIYLQASNRLIQATFGLHEMTPITIGRTQPASSDKNKFLTPVTFSIQSVLRYTEEPSAPIMRDIVANIAASGVEPTEYLEAISLGLPCPDK
jgi:hypothetical protein